MVAVADVIARQYPHRLYVLQGEAAVKQENGDYVAGASSWVLWGSCREEPNGRGQEVVTADRRIYKFQSLVQCPVGTAKVDEGTMCLVSDTELDEDALGDTDSIMALRQDGTVRIIGKCAKFDPGRLHCRLWL